MDEPIARGDCEPRHRVGNSSQSARRFPVAPQTQVPQAKGIEEEDDGSPQSEPQCPVREHRPFEEGVFEGRPASHQHGHQEEGIAGQFLPRRQDRHPGNDRDQRPRLRQCGGGGTVIPHSLYDVGKNKGFVHLNTSHDTSELACDSLAAWWEEEGRAYYPKAKKLLLLCDGGGSNSATMYLFKEDLQ